MVPSDKVTKRKAISYVEEDPLTLLADTELGLFSFAKPSSALKKSKVDTTEEGGESTTTLVSGSFDIPCCPLSGWSLQLPFRTVTLGLYLMLTVKALTKIVQREHLREVGLDRADFLGFLHVMLRSLIQVCASEAHFFYVLLCLKFDFSFLQAAEETRCRNLVSPPSVGIEDIFLGKRELRPERRAL